MTSMPAGPSEGTDAFQPVRLTVVPETAQVAPGGHLALALTIHNASSIVDRYRITVGGVADDWYDLDKASVSLFPSASEDAALYVHPPAGVETTAGRYTLVVQASSETDPTISAIASVALSVDAIGALSMDLLPAQCEGRSGTFRITFSNASNADATVDLEASDDQEGLTFRYEPEGSIIVPAGNERAVRVIATPLVRETIGEPHPYQIEFRGVPGGSGDASAGIGGEANPLLVRQAFYTYLPRYRALSIPRWIRRLPLWALRLLVLLAFLLLLGAGGAVGHVLGQQALARQAATHPKPAVRLPQVKRFAAQVGPHGSVTASWAVAGAKDVRLNGRKVAASGRQTRRVTGPLALTLTATNAGGAITQMLQVAPKPVSVTVPATMLDLPVVHFTTRTDPHTHRLMLVWNVSKAGATYLNGARVKPVETKEITPAGRTTYTLRASNGLGAVKTSIVLDLAALQMPSIRSFTLEHQRLGQPYTLVWQTRDATTVTLNGATVHAAGRFTLHTPVQSKVYQLVAANIHGRAVAIVRVEVRAGSAPPAQAFVLGTPQIVAFATRSRKGKPVVTWKVRNAARVWLQGKLVASSGEKTLPWGAATLRLRAANDVGTDERQLQVHFAAPTATPTPIPTSTWTPVPAATATRVPTATPTAEPSETPTAIPTATPRPAPTATPQPIPTATPLPKPTATPLPKPTATPRPKPTDTPPPKPTATPLPKPTATPIPTATPQPTATPRPTATPVPTATPLPLPTATLQPIAGVPKLDPAVTDPRFGADEAGDSPDMADALGVSWTRIRFGWDVVQHDGPNSWNPFALNKFGSDKVINGEIARGRQIAGLLIGTPPWAQQDPSKGINSVPININKPWNDPKNYWAAYCYKIAKMYAGKIDDWVIWNEVSIPPNPDGTRALWTQWQGTPEQYVKVLEDAYLAIHAANPRARVVMYGEPYWYDHGAYLTHVFNLLAHDDPGNKHNGYFDVANLHLYVGPPSFYPIINQVRGLLRTHGWGQKQIWISETNVEPYDDPGHPKPHTQFRVTMQEQASFMVDALASYVAAGANRVAVYRVKDGLEPARLGLVNEANVPRPEAYTFRFMVRLLKGAVGDGADAYTPGDKLDHKSGVFKVVLRKPGQRITVLWNQDGTDATYTLRARAKSAIRYDKFGRATPIMPYNGVYTFLLPGGHDYTNPYDPRIPTVGGDPVIVVEPMQ